MADAAEGGPAPGAGGPAEAAAEGGGPPAAPSWPDPAPTDPEARKAWEQQIWGLTRDELYQRLKAVEDEGRAGPAAAPEDETEFANEAEQQLISILKTIFHELFEKREKAGTLWPCFFGDIALTRILRGNGGVLRAAGEWFGSMCFSIVEMGADAIVPAMAQALERAQADGRQLTSAYFPHNEKVSKYTARMFTCERLSPQGEPILHNCVCTKAHKKHAILENCYDEYVEQERSMIVGRALQLDSMSRAAGRIVKLILVFDLAGVQGVRDLQHEPFDRKHAPDVGRFMLTTMCDVTRRIFATNVPWWAIRLFNLFQRSPLYRLNLLAQRTLDRVVLLEDGGTTNEDLLGIVGAEQMAQLCALRPAVDDDGLQGKNSGSVEIGPGEAFERILSVVPEQTVKWRFCVQPGSKMLGEPDVEFSAVALLEAPEAGLERTVPSEPTYYGPTDGQEEQSWTAPRGGMLLLTWSNEHSWLRSKTMTFELEL